ncbi:hypothetical protein ScPMuIL_017088 [Solemya velum]
MSQEFLQATEDVRKLTKRPTNEELLEIYALFKQATFGDVNTSRPGMLDRKGRAKWDAWKSKMGTHKERAEKCYIKKVEEYHEKYRE